MSRNFGYALLEQLNTQGNLLLHIKETNLHRKRRIALCVQLIKLKGNLRQIAMIVAPSFSGIGLILGCQVKAELVGWHNWRCGFVIIENPGTSRDMGVRVFQCFFQSKFCRKFWPRRLIPLNRRISPSGSFGRNKFSTPSLTFYSFGLPLQFSIAHYCFIAYICTFQHKNGDRLAIESFMLNPMRTKPW